MVYVTRREVFSSAHRLVNPALSDEENYELYDKCFSPNYHGHNYVLEVVVAGKIDPRTGYVIDLKHLKDIMKKNVTGKMDHRNLNTDVDFLQGINPTAENLAVAIWNQLVNHIPQGKLYSVKIYETENNYAEYKGE